VNVPVVLMLSLSSFADYFIGHFNSEFLRSFVIGNIEGEKKPLYVDITGNM